MNALVAVAAGLGIGAALVAGTYLLVYGVGARAQGYSLFTRQRLRVVQSGTVLCVGGPFDGRSRKVSRWVPLGLACADWLAIAYDARFDAHIQFATLGGRSTNHFPSFIDRWKRGQLWVGTYQLRFMDDCYRWEPTQWPDGTLDDLRAAVRIPSGLGGT